MGNQCFKGENDTLKDTNMSLGERDCSILDALLKNELDIKPQSNNGNIVHTIKYRELCKDLQIKEMAELYHVNDCSNHERSGYNFLKTFVAKCGDNMNSVNSLGSTILHEAVKMSDWPGVLLLIRRGADVTIRDSSGKAPLDYVNTAIHSPYRLSPYQNSPQLTVPVMKALTATNTATVRKVMELVSAPWFESDGSVQFLCHSLPFLPPNSLSVEKVGNNFELNEMCQWEVTFLVTFTWGTMSFSESTRSMLRFSQLLMKAGCSKVVSLNFIREACKPDISGVAALWETWVSQPRTLGQHCVNCIRNNMNSLGKEAFMSLKLPQKVIHSLQFILDC